MPESTDDITDLRSVPREEREKLRSALLEQVEYLIDEVEALRTVTGAVPEAVQSGRPTDEDLSMKEHYAVIAVLDRRERIRWTEKVRDGAGSEPVKVKPVGAETSVRDNDWNDRDMDDVLDEVQAARRDLHDVLSDLDPGVWTREVVLQGETMTLFELVHGFAKSDFNRLRDLGYRLHDADLSEREE